MKYKIIPSQKVAQEIIKPASEPKKALMKTLLVSDFELNEVSKKQEQEVYKISTEAFEMPFYIKKDNSTDEMSLYQDNFLLEDNQYTCELILQKVH